MSELANRLRTTTGAGFEGSRADLIGDADRLQAELDRARATIADLRAHPRDDHHTMDELYEYRMLYNAHAANLWARHGTYFVAKSWNHSDGEPCFGGGWFIVAAAVRGGMISNHYPANAWDLFQVPEMENGPEWDGHTPEIAAQRLRASLELPTDTL